MKELSVEEKAQRYDEALERARYWEKNPTVWSSDDICQKLFPELKESSDERIRKSLLYVIEHHPTLSTEEAEEYIAWLEKQGEQDNNEDEAILHRFSFYSYKDEPNILYLAGLYVNDKYRNKGIGTKILEVADEVAKSLDCYTIRLKTKKDSDAERLYQTHGYNSLAIEERDWIWLEKKSEQKETLCDKCRREHPSHSCQDITELGRCAVEQKPADKVEPKFREGEWLCENEPNNYARFIQILKTVNVQGKERYRISRDIHNDEDVVEFGFVEKYYHKFDIKDAKDGDVLSYRDGQWIFIYKKLVDGNTFCYHALYSTIHCDLTIDDAGFTLLGDAIVPATKEQRDTLVKAMADEGYTFDFEKKELRKIEQKPAWSEEDEAKRNALIGLVEEIKNQPLKRLEDWDGYINWLKSLSPQPHWKPSDKDIKLLKELSDGKICPDNYRTRLYEIINNLKNL